MSHSDSVYLGATRHLVFPPRLTWKYLQLIKKALLSLLSGITQHFCYTPPTPAFFKCQISLWRWEEMLGESPVGKTNSGQCVPSD